MDERIGFALFFGIFIIVYYLLNNFVLSNYIKIFGIEKSIWFHIIVILCALSYVIAAGLESLSDTMLFRAIYVTASVWMGVLFLLFCTLLMYFLINVITPITSRITGIVMLCIVLVLSIYGVVNAYTFHLKEINLYNDKDVDMRVLQISDIHLGPINGKGYLTKIVDKVNSANPDIVLITGDLLDGRYHYDKEELLALNNISAPVYFSSGNHDDYANLSIVKGLLTDTKVKWLRNELVEHNGIYIIGLDDTRDSKNVGAMLYALNMEHNLSKKYTILMNHRPIGWRDASKYVNLMLSGHTHAGQIWPFNYMVLLEGNILHGIHRIDGNTQFMLYVSPGTGTWGPPMRIGSRTEVTVFNLKSQKK
ncbi:MAG: metallophosphoesterase [Candidatus Woesearchaeota archaeon]